MAPEAVETAHPQPLRTLYLQMLWLGPLVDGREVGVRNSIVPAEGILIEKNPCESHAEGNG